MDLHSLQAIRYGVTLESVGAPITGQYHDSACQHCRHEQVRRIFRSIQPWLGCKVHENFLPCEESSRARLPVITTTMQAQAVLNGGRPCIIFALMIMTSLC